MSGSVPKDSAIASTSAAALYGRGIFTTIAIADGEAFLWEKHWRRLTEAAQKLGIDMSDHPEKSTRNSLAHALTTNQLSDGRARITFFDESESEIWGAKDETKTSLLITTAAFREVPEHFRVTISPFPVNSRSPLSSVKSCNYLEPLLALEEAKKRGFHECIRLNEHGHITSAAMANIFWLRAGGLFTPSLKTGCLQGTTRELVLEKIDCSEAEETIDTLKDAEAIFLTSAGLGITQVAAFDGKELADLNHPIVDLVPRRH